MKARSDTICGGSAQAGEITDTFANIYDLVKTKIPFGYLYPALCFGMVRGNLKGAWETAPLS
jgi:hypothetical protein